MVGQPHEENTLLRQTLVVLLLLAGTVHARSGSVIRHQPLTEDSEDRPVATEITVSGQGSEYALRIVFNKAPFATCGNRCANVTVLLDTDANRRTGMQLGGVAETGADLAVTLQGTSDREGTLRAKVRHLPDSARSLEEGEVFAELELQEDPDKLQIDDRTVLMLGDAGNAGVPGGARARVSYHPPGSKALTAEIKVGKTRTAGGRSGPIEVLKAGEKEKGKRR